MTPLQFIRQPKSAAAHFWGVPGSTKTVLVSSHIWWTDCIAYSLLQLGYNVLLTEPWYVFFTDDAVFSQFDARWSQWLAQIRQFNVQLIVGGNSTAIVPHPRTGELLHDAAGLPLINYWWDEPRQIPPLMRRGHTIQTYLDALRHPRTINAVWDLDVAEELSAFFGLENVIHSPLATTPDLWPARDVPMQQRSMVACFLGNCFHDPQWESRLDAQRLQRAQAVVDQKLANLDRPMIECVQTAAQQSRFDLSHFSGNSSSDDTALHAAFEQWSAVEIALRERLRNQRLRTLLDHLKDKLVVCGRWWENMNVKAHKEHSGVPDAADYYVNSKASLNLAGGCVHGGQPLRPYEIAASNGLIFTQYSRELPSLFDLDKECVSFGTDEQMLAALDRVLKSPAEFDAVVAAGRRRVQAQHNWAHRMARLMGVARQHFSLPW